MRNTTFGMLVLAGMMMTAGPLLAQSANRTGAPTTPVKVGATALAVEAPGVAKCRLHCQTQPNGSASTHSVRSVAEAGAQQSACAKKMVVR
jgi:hypothetical protein